MCMTASDTAVVFAVEDDVNIMRPAACIQPILDSHLGLLNFIKCLDAGNTTGFHKSISTNMGIRKFSSFF